MTLVDRLTVRVPTVEDGGATAEEADPEYFSSAATVSRVLDGDERWLGRYTCAVAALLGVPRECVLFEVADTASAYLALIERVAAIPDRDLMLVWSGETGWEIAVETTPAEHPRTLARLPGAVLPPPRDVAAFTERVLHGSPPCPPAGPTGRAHRPRGSSHGRQRPARPDPVQEG